MDTKSDKLSKVIGIKEAAKMLNIHPATLRRWSGKGKIKPLIVSKRGDRRYRFEDIKKFIEEA